MLPQKIMGLSESGGKREANEDLLWIDLEKRIFVLLDGFSGDQQGPMVVERIKNHLLNSLEQITNDPDKTLPFYFSSRWPIRVNALVNGMHQLNEELYLANQKRSLVQGVGSSVLCFIEDEGNWYIVSSGNLTVWPIRHDLKVELTTSDSFMLEQGIDAALPKNGLGLFPLFSCDIRQYKPEPNDILYLFSDGLLSTMLSQSVDFLKMVDVETVNLKVESLMDLAKKSTNKDNKTLLLVFF